MYFQFLPEGGGDQTDNAQCRQVPYSQCVVETQPRSSFCIQAPHNVWNIMEVFCCYALVKFQFCTGALCPPPHIHHLPLLLFRVSDKLNDDQRIWAFQMFAFAADIQSVSKRRTQSNLCFVCTPSYCVCGETNGNKYSQACQFSGTLRLTQPNGVSHGGMHGKGTSERLFFFLLPPQSRMCGLTVLDQPLHSTHCKSLIFVKGVCGLTSKLSLEFSW